MTTSAEGQRGSRRVRGFDRVAPQFLVKVLSNAGPSHQFVPCMGIYRWCREQVSSERETNPGKEGRGGAGQATLREVQGQPRCPLPPSFYCAIKFNQRSHNIILPNEQMLKIKWYAYHSNILINYEKYYWNK